MSKKTEIMKDIERLREALNKAPVSSSGYSLELSRRLDELIVSFYKAG
ncbi:aspartyl-phosphate phosphatase Spo0E family protein [Paenibacillus pasadenensis]|nr:MULTISPECIES: aspartyl-phosphate phosphatase Spo0E family protein [Paenibacillus]QGG56838.1 Spo0E family sporulation regulatory protein-aspartic acid phosphatase [Paenibacillus sp. B01]